MDLAKQIKVKTHRRIWILLALLVVTAAVAGWIEIERHKAASRAAYQREVQLNNYLAALAAKGARLEEEHARVGLSPIQIKQREARQAQAKVKEMKASLDKLMLEYQQAMVEAQRKKQEYEAASILGKLRIRISSLLK